MAFFQLEIEGETYGYGQKVEEGELSPEPR